MIIKEVKKFCKSEEKRIKELLKGYVKHDQYSGVLLGKSEIVRKILEIINNCKEGNKI